MSEAEDYDDEFEDVEDVDDEDSPLGLMAELVRAAGGMSQTTLGELRAELGYKKLGKWVLTEVAAALGEAKLGFFPQWKLWPESNSEPRAGQRLWIYVQDGGPVAQVINVVQHPEAEDDVFATLGSLMTNPQGLDAERKLDLIRAILAAP